MTILLVRSYGVVADGYILELLTIMTNLGTNYPEFPRAGLCLGSQMVELISRYLTFACPCERTPTVTSGARPSRCELL